MKTYLIKGLIFPFFIQAADEEKAKLQLKQMLGPFVNMNTIHIEEYWQISQEYFRPKVMFS